MLVLQLIGVNKRGPKQAGSETGFCCGEVLTHLLLDKTPAISPTIFSDEFSWMKIFTFWLKFHCCLSPMVQLTIIKHWFRQWLGTEQATSHYMNQCWPDSPTHICGTRARWVKVENLGFSSVLDQILVINFIQWCTMCEPVYIDQWFLHNGIYLYNIYGLLNNIYGLLKWQ